MSVAGPDKIIKSWFMEGRQRQSQIGFAETRNNGVGDDDASSLADVTFKVSNKHSLAVRAQPHLPSNCLLTQSTLHFLQLKLLHSSSQPHRPLLLLLPARLSSLNTRILGLDHSANMFVSLYWLLPVLSGLMWFSMLCGMLFSWVAGGEEYL